LHAAWQRLEPPVATRQPSAAEIDALETRYNIRLPAPFRAYLERACPIEDPPWDDNLTNWWPLARIRSVAEELPDKALGHGPIPPPEMLLIFADFMIWCWAWAIDCSPGPGHGKILIVGDRPRVVSDSFTTFVERYLLDDTSVS
jgi:hypothetical protein